MAGDWYLAVINRETNAVSYSVLVTTRLAPIVISLTNAVPYTNIVRPASIDYYVFAVSNSSVRAQFEVLSPSSDVQLVVRQASLPTAATFDFRSDNPGTTNEFIVVFTNSVPPLSAGDWYLGVINPGGSAVSYTVRALQFEETGTDVAVTGIMLVGSSLCITWDNALVGVQYVIQGKASIVDPVWLDASAPITATNSLMTHCLALPTPYSFFRVAEYRPPANAFVVPSLSSLVSTGNGFTLTWTAPASARFVVQWSATIAPPSWTMFTNIVTSATGTFTFTDDGSQTQGSGTLRFYRILLVP
jgi:hypothetical protein